MLPGDEMAEDSLSLLIGALELNASADSLSPDDLAWVDSCLVKDPVLSNDNWSSVKETLVEILGSQPESHNSSAPTDDGSPGVPVKIPSITAGNALVIGAENTDDIPRDKEMEMKHDRLLVVEETAMTSSQPVRGDVFGGDCLEATVDDMFLPNYREENSSEMNNDCLPRVEETAESLLQPFGGDGSEYTLNDIFQPNYREDNQRLIEPLDSGLDFNFSDDETEPSSKDVFRVWDLGIPAEVEEVDELVRQLNKALAESSSVQAGPLPSSDSRESIDLKEEPIDDLIAGIMDLSLDQISN